MPSPSTCGDYHDPGYDADFSDLQNLAPALPVDDNSFYSLSPSEEHLAGLLKASMEATDNETRDVKPPISTEPNVEIEPSPVVDTKPNSDVETASGPVVDAKPNPDVDNNTDAVTESNSGAPSEKASGLPYLRSPESVTRPTAEDVPVKIGGIFVDLPKVWDHLVYLSSMTDQVRSLHIFCEDHRSDIKTKLTKLWADNPTIRKRNLRGGTARRQRSALGNYVPFADTKAEGSDVFKHRMEVERKDLVGRNRIAGLVVSKELLEDTFNYLRREQEKCFEILDSGEAWRKDNVDAVVVKKLSTYEAYIWNKASAKENKDTEDLIKTFYAEYDFNTKKL